MMIFALLLTIFDDDSKKPVLVSAKLYNANLDAVKENEYNCLTLFLL